MGKVETHLTEQLGKVEWGEYKLGELFEVQTSKKRFDANKVEILGYGHPYVVRTALNNGIKGFLNEDPYYLNEGNTISFGQDTATMFYQKQPYFTGDKIKILKAKNDKFGEKNAQFFISLITKAFSTFSWGNTSFNVKVIENQTILLPTQNGKIDFDFMENFISQLEAFRLSQLEAYLLATGLKDYTINLEENQVVMDFESEKVQWGEFKFEDIFDTIKQGRRLKKEDQIEGDIPFVMAGITNTGVVNYISNPVASFPKNSITIDIFGNAFYRNYDFGAGDDTGVYWNTQKILPKEAMLFLTKASEKALEGKFSYGKKLRSSQSLKFKMALPTKNNTPDYNYMALLISAIQKLVIKDVVLYADRKIAATKHIIESNNTKR
ncbi:restriction endonuclease subunit S [Pasteurella canis]|uniref:restriction endonuclease subunit S n=1 Tax=Pasteurella canis TaxID=753 RepID=UPI001745D05D|nr:restriction endonuclease subunit S [Pasteurella canis]